MNNSGFYPNTMYQNQNPIVVPQQGSNPNQNSGIPVYNNNINSSFVNNSNHVDYADNIFYLNIGRRVTVYFSYPDSIEWRDKAFYGTIVDAGRDYLLIKDNNNKSVLLWLIYINYAVFDGDIVHNYNN